MIGFLLFFFIFFSAFSQNDLKLSVLDANQEPSEITLSKDDSQRLLDDSVTLKNLIEDTDPSQNAPIPLQITKRQLDLFLRFLKFDKEKKEQLEHHALLLPIESIRALLINADYLASITLQPIFEKILAAKILEPTELKKLLNDPSYLKKLYLPDHLQNSLAKALVAQAWIYVSELFAPLTIKNQVIAADSHPLVKLLEVNNRLCILSPENEIKIWDTNKSKFSTLTTVPVDIMAWAGRNSILYIGDESGTLQLWDLIKRRQIKEQKKHIWAITALTLNLDGSTLFSAGKDRKVLTWDAKTGDFISPLVELAKEEAWALASYDSLLLIGQTNGVIDIFDYKSKNQVATLNAHTKRISQLILNTSKKILFSASADTHICGWNLETKQLIFKSSTHKKEISCLAYGPDGYLISSGEDQTIRLWDDKTGKLLFTIEVPNKKTITSIIVKDDASLITGSMDGTIRSWDLAPLKKIIFYLLNNLTLDQALIMVSPAPINFKEQPHLLSAFKNLDENIQYLLIESKKVVPPSLSWSGPVFTGYKFLKSIFNK